MPYYVVPWLPSPLLHKRASICERFQKTLQVVEVLAVRQINSSSAYCHNLTYTVDWLQKTAPLQTVEFVEFCCELYSSGIALPRQHIYKWTLQVVLMKRDIKLRNIPRSYCIPSQTVTTGGVLFPPKITVTLSWGTTPSVRLLIPVCYTLLHILSNF